MEKISQEEFKKRLNPGQHRVMREGEAEPPFLGKFWDHDENGVYSCAACNSALFTSLSKFESEEGWPTFKKPISENSIEAKKTPQTNGSFSIRCKNCQSHLGYLVPGDEPYYRINSVGLAFTEMPELDEPEDDTKKEEEKRSEVIDQPIVMQATPTKTLSTASLLLVGGVAGMVLGGSGAYTLCRQMNAVTLTPIVTTTVATSTVLSALPVASSSNPKRPIPQIIKNGTITAPTSPIRPAATTSSTPNATTTPNAAGTL